MAVPMMELEPVHLRSLSPGIRRWRKEAQTLRPCFHRKSVLVTISSDKQCDMNIIKWRTLVLSVSVEDVELHLQVIWEVCASCAEATLPEMISPGRRTARSSTKYGCETIPVSPTGALNWRRMRSALCTVALTSGSLWTATR